MSSDNAKLMETLGFSATQVVTEERKPGVEKAPKSNLLADLKALKRAEQRSVRKPAVTHLLPAIHDEIDALVSASGLTKSKVIEQLITKALQKD